MKRLLNYFPLFIIVVITFASCQKEDTFDDLLLLGKWRSSTAAGPGSVYYRYDTGGTGVTWDTGDDVTEEEAQAYTWTLVKSELTHIHIIELGGSVPKVYTVTELTESSLKYKDDFNSYVFKKVTL